MAKHNWGEMLAEVTWDDHKAELAQVIFEVAGFPMADCPQFSDYVSERLGRNGRELFATQAIDAFTFLRIPKLRLFLSDTELADLHLEFSEFNRQAVPEILGYPSLFAVLVQYDDIPHGSDMLCFVGTFLRRGLLEDAMVADLMAYDSFGANYIAESFTRLKLGDVLWLHFWCQELDGAFASTTVWRVFSFIMSHAFKNDCTMLTFSPFLKANCPKDRWDWYLAGSDEAVPPASENYDEGPVGMLLGNFEDVEPWGRQSTVGPGQIPADECVMVMKSVGVGQAVELDYGSSYMLSREKQLLQFRGHELERLIERVFARVDARVLAAFRAYMGGAHPLYV